MPVDAFFRISGDCPVFILTITIPVANSDCPDADADKGKKPEKDGVDKEKTKNIAAVSVRWFKRFMRKSLY
jgi:hypothetical protein